MEENIYSVLVKFVTGNRFLNFEYLKSTNILCEFFTMILIIWPTLNNNVFLTFGSLQLTQNYHFIASLCFSTKY